jgi:hypothetical protein
MLRIPGWAKTRCAMRFGSMTECKIVLVLNKLQDWPLYDKRQGHSGKGLFNIQISGTIPAPATGQEMSSLNVVAYLIERDGRCQR